MVLVLQAATGNSMCLKLLMVPSGNLATKSDKCKQAEQQKHTSLRCIHLLEGGDLLLGQVLAPVERRRAVVRQQLARELCVHAIRKGLGLSP